jgi:hypothetical protein
MDSMEPALLAKLHEEAVRRGLAAENTPIDAAAAFSLVRDMTYQRSSDRRPETLIREWRGTCSGKHYLLGALFAELGFASRLIACTTETYLWPEEAHEKLRPVLERANGRVVDLHNYLVVEHPQGKMVVDATWPTAYRKYGMVVNEDFVPGVDQHIAANPIEVWDVPPDRDPQEFKEDLLKECFTLEELAVREEFILILGELFAEDG